MAWWRHSRSVQAATMFLLLWTAADLTNPSLCALDKEDARQTVPAGPGSTAFHQDSRTDVPSPARPHIDDCFCCSHCVEVQGLAALGSELVNREVQSLVPVTPRLFGSRLYHPPLL